LREREREREKKKKKKKSVQRHRRKERDTVSICVLVWYSRIRIQYGFVGIYLIRQVLGPQFLDNISRCQNKGFLPSGKKT
jgi:hypothetical protein